MAPLTPKNRAVNARRFKLFDSNGGSWERGYNREVVTLSTVALYTDSTADLLPANSLIEAVCFNVNTAITTATMWWGGDPTTFARFTDTQTGLTLGTAVVGMSHQDQPAPPRGRLQSSAAKVRVTFDAIPGAGVIEVIVWFSKFVAPTS